MTDKEKTFSCICQKQGCWRDEARAVPSYCQANRHPDVLEKARDEYRNSENIRIYEAACIVGAENNGFRPRIEEALHFARQMNFSKIGFAACVAFDAEMAVIRDLFTREGCSVVCAGCQIGSDSAEDRQAPHLKGYPNEHCNPIAQAKLLNAEKTELNFIVGLCLGHDILFTRYAKAPVSTLIVKDRMTANNPAGALTAWHARQHLFFKDNYRYGGKE